MSLQVPNLDDRTFQDIVSEARSKIPQYCPKWTDYNLSDPGITLIELFAWMVEMLLYRLNKVPDKNYIKFMELLGIQLQPPKPATVDVTFRLSAPQPEIVTIPTGTEVATVRTETQDAIIFSTNRDAHILIPTLIGAFTAINEVSFNDVIDNIKNPYREVNIFQDTPQTGDALYLGYDENLSSHTIVLTVESMIEGIGVDPLNPPWAWEYWDIEKEQWDSLRLETDTTRGLNTSGHIILHFPQSSGKNDVNDVNACWIRCRATEPEPGQGEYSRSPIVKTVLTESIGYTVSASQGSRVINELLGESDGNPGQQFQLQNLPVLQRKPGETIEVETETEGVYELWQEVSNFADSGPDDLHFTCDSVSGDIRFGPSIRQPSGNEKQYGKIPPAGRWIRFTSYRSGGGVIGNVGKGTITVLKSSIPYLASVTNFEAASGGTDSETLESAKLRVPGILKSNTRAVTREDYETMALEASPKISRSRCYPADYTGRNGIPPGTVRLLLVPRVKNSAGYISEEDLSLSPSVREQVRLYLDRRRLLATALEITTPEYVQVSVKIEVKLREDINHQQIVSDIEECLYQYINPIIGGPSGDGWPFGRNLTISDVNNAVRNIKEIDYIKEIQLFPVTMGQRQESVTFIEIPPEGLACSFQHEIVII